VNHLLLGVRRLTIMNIELVLVDYGKIAWVNFIQVVINLQK
jgi:hypothetical protein